MKFTEFLLNDLSIFLKIEKFFFFFQRDYTLRMVKWFSFCKFIAGLQIKRIVNLGLSFRPCFGPGLIQVSC